MDDFLNQVEKMCHAIGFEPTETRKNQRVHEYYRNYFCTGGGKDKETWEELVKLGYAKKTPSTIINDYYYYVTQAGLDFLSSIYKIKFKPMK